MSNFQEDWLLIAMAFYIQNKKIKNKKRCWVKNWLKNRENFSHNKLINELHLEPTDWNNYFRMDEETYGILLKGITPLIEKKDTVMRVAITPHERLAATLRFFATGRNYEDLKFTTCISPQALGYIIPETSKAILNFLRKDFLKFPKTADDWKEIAERFEKSWNFPNCLGAVDGKHVRITPPPGSGSYFYNYKGFNSIVLMAIANSNYEFLYCDVGTNGRISDGGVIENTTFYKKLMTKTLNIPVDSNNLPYTFIGDEAFSLRTDFMKPYNQKELNYQRKIFNYLLSRARRVIENVFGILTARFRIFHTTINLKLETIELIVLACCCLHNFLRRNCSNTYFSDHILYSEDHELGTITEGIETQENTLLKLQRTHNRHSSEDAKYVRNLFLDYFNGEGKVPWQDKMIKK